MGISAIEKCPRLQTHQFLRHPVYFPSTCCYALLQKPKLNISYWLFFSVLISLLLHPYDMQSKSCFMDCFRRTPNQGVHLCAGNRKILLISLEVGCFLQSIITDLIIGSLEPPPQLSKEQVSFGLAWVTGLLMD